MAAASATLLKKRFDAVKVSKSNIEGVFELIEHFVLPFSADFYNAHVSELSFDWRRRDIYDSTAIIAAQNLAANLHSGLTNPVVRWFDIRFRDRQLNTNAEAAAWLQEASRRVFFALQESNFNMAVNETYLDLVGYGSSVLVEEVDESDSKALNEVDFQSLPLDECFFEQGYDGSIQYLYRPLSWTPVEALSKFGEDCPDDVNKAAHNAQGIDQAEEYLFCIFPRREYANADVRKFIPAEKRPFGYMYIRTKDCTRIGKEGGYYEMPAFIPRWRKTSKSMWGHSPAMVCLSDILSLNQLTELVLIAGEKVVDPPIMTTRRGIWGDLDVEAGGLTVVQSKDALWPFESGARFDVSSLQKEAFQQSIREAFFMDQLQLKDSPAMTATEVQVRFELMQRLIGPTLGRLQYDFLDPLIRRTFNILFRYQMLGQVPQVVVDKAAELDIQYLGPLSRTHRSDEAASIERWTSDIMAMSEQYPKMKHIVDEEAVGRELADIRSIPAHLVKNKAKFNAAVAAEEKAVQKAQQVEQMEKMMGGLSKLGNLAGEGNPIAAAA